jgi:hypothetical protein
VQLFAFFSVVPAVGCTFKSNSADVVSSTPKPFARSLLNHETEANNTSVTVSKNFTVEVFVTDTGTSAI